MAALAWGTCAMSSQTCTIEGCNTARRTEATCAGRYAIELEGRSRMHMISAPKTWVLVMPYRLRGWSHMLLIRHSGVEARVVCNIFSLMKVSLNSSPMLCC